MSAVEWSIRHEEIERNSAKCCGCGDEIESRGRNELVSCSCGAVFVDGGKEYRRRGWDGRGAGYLDTSIYTVWMVDYDRSMNEVGRRKVGDQ